MFTSCSAQHSLIARRLTVSLVFCTSNNSKKMEWKKEDVLKLIQMYHDRPVLWNQMLPQHKEKNARHDSLMEIAVSLGLGKEEVEKK